MRFIYTILASEKLLGLSATAPRECSRGDSQCVAVFGGDSYCKYWQSPSVCHGSSTPCECDGSLPIVPGVVPTSTETSTDASPEVATETMTTETSTSPTPADAAPQRRRRVFIINSDAQPAGSSSMTTTPAATTTTDTTTEYSTESSTETTTEFTTETTTEYSTETTTEFTTETTTEYSTETARSPTSADAAPPRRRRVHVVQAAPGSGQVGSSRSVILTTSTTTQSSTTSTPERVQPRLGAGPQATASSSAPALVPEGMPEHFTRTRAIVERYIAGEMSSPEMFNRISGMMGQVEAEIGGSTQSFETVFDQLGGNRLLDHVRDFPSLPRRGPIFAIMTMVGSLKGVFPSSLIPPRISRDFCTSNMATLRGSVTEAGMPVMRLSSTFAAGWVRICPEIADSPEVSRLLLMHAIRRHQIEFCSTEQCEPLAINTPRAEILEHAFGLLGSSRSSGSIDPSLLLQLLAGVSSASLGETGYGPGVIRDWFTTLSIQLFGAIEFGIYERSESPPHNTRISPMLKLTEPERFQAWYRMSGRFMALSIIQGIPIGINFPRFYYSAILDQRPTLEDISVDDPELHRSLLMILDMTDEQLEAIGVGLEGSGFEDTPLNSENRIEQITARMSRMLLAPSDVSEQMAALKAGFFEVLPRHLFEGFTPAQLRAFIVGNEAIDVADLRRNVRVVNTNGPSYNQDSPQVVWFMEMMDEMDEAEKRNVLRWITGSSQVPLGGFANLRPDPMLITPLLNSGDGHLPTAHTCFNWIEIPRYSSKEILIQKVKQAVAHMEMGTA